MMITTFDIQVASKQLESIKEEIKSNIKRYYEI